MSASPNTSSQSAARCKSPLGVRNVSALSSRKSCTKSRVPSSIRRRLHRRLSLRLPNIPTRAPSPASLVAGRDSNVGLAETVRLADLRDLRDATGQLGHLVIGEVVGLDAHLLELLAHVRGGLGLLERGSELGERRLRSGDPTGRATL